MSEAMFTAPFDAQMSLVDAREVLRDLAVVGHDCPLCRQVVRIYRRRLTSVPVRALIALYRYYGRGFAHMPTVVDQHMADVAHQGGMANLSQHWGLILEERRIHRGDGGRPGYWRVTDLGERFLNGEATVPRYAHVYNGRRLKLTGDEITVQEALGGGFHFGELMGTLSDPADDDGQPALFADAA